MINKLNFNVYDLNFETNAKGLEFKRKETKLSIAICIST